jgi:hypothetical protein
MIRAPPQNTGETHRLKTKKPLRGGLGKWY